MNEYIIYGMSENGHYVLKRDGCEVLRGTEDEVWSWLHKHHSYSVSHALKYEGYSISPEIPAPRA